MMLWSTCTPMWYTSLVYPGLSCSIFLYKGTCPAGISRLHFLPLLILTNFHNCTTIHSKAKILVMTEAPSYHLLLQLKLHRCSLHQQLEKETNRALYKLQALQKQQISKQTFLKTSWSSQQAHLAICHCSVLNDKVSRVKAETTLEK